MLLLRRSRHNVIRQWSRHLSSANATPTIQDDASNAFISYNSEASKSSSRLAVKDNICTADLPTTCASKALDGFQSPYEATVVSLLKQNGYQVVGKTNMDEFGMGSHSMHSHFGRVSQLHLGADGIEVEYSAGGSSGGSALAVKNGQCEVALGTDTGGSVRLPASYCGIIGFKPSYGLISRWGVIDYANSFDTVGFFGRTVEQVSQMFESTQQHDLKDPTSLQISTKTRLLEGIGGKEQSRKKHTIGVPMEYNIAELSPLVKQAWTSALEGLQDLGHKIVPVSLPSTKSALSAYYVLAPAEASSNLAKYDGVRYGTRAEGPDGLNSILFSKTRSQGLGSEVKRRILLGSYSLSADAIDNYFIQAQKLRRKVQMDFNRVFAASHPLLAHPADSRLDHSGKVDFILCPTAPTPPPRLDDIAKQKPVEAYVNDVFTVPASMAGLPAVSVPWGNPERADPSKNVGLQIIGQFGHDRGVLEFAARLQDMQNTAKG